MSVPADPLPPTPTTGPVERKVKAATVAAYLGGVALLGVLNAVQGNHDMIDFMPDWAAAVVFPVVPAAITAVAGYLARHTPRTDTAAVAAGTVAPD